MKVFKVYLLNLFIVLVLLTVRILSILDKLDSRDIWILILATLAVAHIFLCFGLLYYILSKNRMLFVYPDLTMDRLETFLRRQSIYHFIIMYFLTFYFYITKFNNPDVKFIYILIISPILFYAGFRMGYKNFLMDREEGTVNDDLTKIVPGSDCFKE